MADVIRLTASEVTELSNQFKSASEQTNEMLNHLEKQVYSAAAGWEGEAYNAFVEKFEEVRNQMNSVVEMYSNIDAMLDGVVKTIQETDTGIAGQIKG